MTSRHSSGAERHYGGTYSLNMAILSIGTAEWTLYAWIFTA